MCVCLCTRTPCKNLAIEESNASMRKKCDEGIMSVNSYSAHMQPGFPVFKDRVCWLHH